jgi:enoyl-[acyl-carrier protein] reductase I
MPFMSGKRALIMGVASTRSIAWGIAQAMHREGAELAFTYQGERLEGRVRDLAATVDSDRVFPCDVGDDDSIAAAIDGLGAHWDVFDVIVHAIAYAPRESIKGGFVESTEREFFRIAHDISSYSLTGVARAASSRLRAGGAIVTLSYLGARSVVPNYNVMGLAKASLEANVRYLAADLGSKNIRVNAISAGPIKTLAAAGISDFRSFLDQAKNTAPLKRNVSTEEVGNAAAFLCSNLASGITGEVLYVDAGYNIMGLSPK